MSLNKTDFHPVYYIGTMPRFVTGGNLFFGDNSLYIRGYVLDIIKIL